jgi:hypothetical protein
MLIIFIINLILSTLIRFLCLKYQKESYYPKDLFSISKFISKSIIYLTITTQFIIAFLTIYNFYFEKETLYRSFIFICFFNIFFPHSIYVVQLYYNVIIYRTSYEKTMGIIYFFISINFYNFYLIYDKFTVKYLLNIYPYHLINITTYINIVFSIYFPIFFGYVIRKFGIYLEKRRI